MAGKNKKLELLKAEQQFTGFDLAYTGGSVEELVESMGLDAKEWDQVKKDMPWLTERLVEYVDEYFEKKGA